MHPLESISQKRSWPEVTEKCRFMAGVGGIVGAGVGAVVGVCEGIAVGAVVGGSEGVADGEVGIRDGAVVGSVSALRH